VLYPTHGFGSFCAASQSSAQSSTIGAERRANPVLTLDEQAFVETLLAGLDAWPAYYAHMGPANLAGPGEPDLSPPRRASADQLRRRIEAGEWVVDLRGRVAFATGFLPGSLSFPLDGSFASYLGWTIPWGTPVTLLGETPEQVTQAQRELVRIGIERPEAAATGQPADWSGGLPLATLRLAKFGDLAAASRRSAGNGTDPLVVLDVRQRLEWESGHLAGAVHIPLDRLAGRMAGIPPGDLWVHCHSGYRASAAASLLAASGRAATCVNDEFGNAEAAGLRVVPG
jgi:rhodanese-related sulfurtransferase